jgi:hypothetical protein
MASAAQKISMGVSATPALTRNQDCVAPVGRLFTSCALQSNQTTGYQVTVSSPSRTPTTGIVNLSYVEQDGYQTERAGHTAVTASFQWFAASALKIRSVDRETRWR